MNATRIVASDIPSANPDAERAHCPSDSALVLDSHPRDVEHRRTPDDGGPDLVDRPTRHPHRLQERRKRRIRVASLSARVSANRSLRQDDVRETEGPGVGPVEHESHAGAEYGLDACWRVVDVASANLDDVPDRSSHASSLYRQCPTPVRPHSSPTRDSDSPITSSPPGFNTLAVLRTTRSLSDAVK